jgi:hypothetical protein
LTHRGPKSILFPNSLISRFILGSFLPTNSNAVVRQWLPLTTLRPTILSNFEVILLSVIVPISSAIVNSLIRAPNFARQNAIFIALPPFTSVAEIPRRAPPHALISPIKHQVTAFEM